MYVHNNSFLAISWQSAIQVSMLNFYCVKFRQDLKSHFMHGSHFSALTKFPDFSSISPHFSVFFLKKI